ncbi:MAG: ParB N-terminal domain-containing protein [Bacteroidetes bacterium]|nr:ParB N-terminal domain-containing protein [Bacteroidota bacterium]
MNKTKYKTMEFRNPKDLKPHEAHSRIYLPGETLSLEKSIERLGRVIKHPIDITPEGEILAGVRRNQAAINLDMTEVPVNVVNLSTIEEIVEHIIEDNLQRVKTWAEVYNEIREKRKILGNRQGARTDTTKEEKIDTRKQIASELGIKPNVVRVLELIGDQPEHKSLLERDTEHNTVNKLETDYEKRLSVSEEVVGEEFPIVDLEPHYCPVCHSYPRRIITDYVNKLMTYVDDKEQAI